MDCNTAGAVAGTSAVPCAIASSSRTGCRASRGCSRVCGRPAACGLVLHRAPHSLPFVTNPISDPAGNRSLLRLTVTVPSSSVTSTRTRTGSAVISASCSVGIAGISTTCGPRPTQPEEAARTVSTSARAAFDTLGLRRGGGMHDATDDALDEFTEPGHTISCPLARSSCRCRASRSAPRRP